jgi:allantoin racemase
MPFRLSVINPNSDAEVTEQLRLVSSRVLPSGSTVRAVGCPDSPPVIETALDDVMAGPAVIAAALQAGETDAFLVGCFGDPAVAALRELSAVPVVGLGEAALVQASLVTSRFGVITTLERGVAALWTQLDQAGAARACVGIRSVEAAAAAQAAPGPGGGYPSEELYRLLTQQGSGLLENGADGLVLACAGFGRFTEQLTASLAIPVCDGIGVGACLAYGLAASGTRTSKRGGYAWPAEHVSAALAARAGLAASGVSGDTSGTGR